MMMPSIFDESLFDDMFAGFPFDREFFPRKSESCQKHTVSLMRTDIKENEGNYEMAIDLPGYKKEDIQVQLDNGYLTIQAVRNENKEEKDENGKFIRQERYAGSCRRSFYVGRGVTQEQITGKFEDGTLKLFIPKADPNQVAEKKYIAIEG